MQFVIIVLKKGSIIFPNAGAGKVQPEDQIHPSASFLVNQVLLENSHAHELTCYLGLLSYHEGKIEQL